MWCTCACLCVSVSASDPLPITQNHTQHTQTKRAAEQPAPKQNKTITTYTPSHPAYCAQRLLDPKYYGHDRESMVLALSEILHLGCRFVVGGRMEGAQGGVFLTLEVCGWVGCCLYFSVV